MHNFVKPVKTVNDSLTMVGKGLHSPKKEFFEANHATLQALYLNYDVLAGKDGWHLLKQQWPIKLDDDPETKRQIGEKRKWANQLYGEDRPFVNNHWEYLTKQNSGETLYCPICGLHECEEMDHFVPRDETQFPEYSAHLSNLIPLCHNCNHKKSTKFLGKSGERLFFNAFYDVLKKRDILICNITLCPEDGLPQIEANYNPSLTKTDKPDKYILSTIAELDLMVRFDAKAKHWLKYEMNRLVYRKGQNWDMIKGEMKALSVPVANDPDIVHPAVLGAIANSAVMENWFKSL